MVKVSVIMGIYNCANTLQQALDSLYEQTFQDFEVVLCDDGSTDETFDIAEQNRIRFPNRIKLIRNAKNCGLNHTLNNCLAIAGGKYIARMDGDDLSLPDRLKKEVDFLDKHPQFAIVSGPMIYFDEKGEFRRGKGFGEVTKLDFINGTPFCHAPCMVRREAYEAVGGYTVDIKLLRVEDYHLWFKMYAAGFKGYNLSDPIYAMRDDRNARQRRRFKNYLNETRVKLWGFHKIKIPLKYWLFAFRPIAVALLPTYFYQYLHKRNLR